jgi:two-component system, NarL family, sensor kinase
MTMVDPSDEMVDRPARERVRQALVRHVAISLLTFALVAVGAVLWSRHLARDETLRDAAKLGETMAVTVVGPVVTSALDRQLPEAVQAVDRVVRPQLLAGHVLQARIWRRDGTVLYSTSADLIGRRLPMEADVVAAFDGAATADISRLSRAENAFDHRSGTAVEAYAPFRDPNGQTLLYEFYVPVSRFLPQGEAAVNREVLPLALTLLLVLQLVQLPLTRSLTRTVRGTEQARRRAVDRTATALDAERRRLARFLHDEVVQDLAGVAYALGAIPAVLPERTPDGVRRILANSGQAVRRDLGLLRGLLMDLYPARLEEIGLPTALQEQLRPLSDAGMAVELLVGPEVDPPPTVAAVAFNVVREALRNVDQHAGAGRVLVRVAQDDTRLRLSVQDDGQGFELAQIRQGAANGTGGHFGLRLLWDSVTDLGGSFQVVSVSGEGTTVRADLPLAAAGK